MITEKRDLGERLLEYAARTIKLVKFLPNTLVGRRLGDQSDTPRKAGGLMSGAASKAVVRNVRFASMPEAVRTPKGLKLSSRGQGHAFCARRPRIASLPILPTLQGSNGSAPPGPRGFHRHRYRRFHLRLLTLLPLRGSWQRSNLFESHGSNQWLTTGTVTAECHVSRREL
jgi:hypothetical protein